MFELYELQQNSTQEFPLFGIWHDTPWPCQQSKCHYHQRVKYRWPGRKHQGENKREVCIHFDQETYVFLYKSVLH